MPKTFTDDEAEYMTQSATHHFYVTDNRFLIPHTNCTRHNKTANVCLACSMDQYAEEKTRQEKTTEKNLNVRSGARRFVLKLYRHEASRGLFATAELLVY